MVLPEHGGHGHGVGDVGAHEVVAPVAARLQRREVGPVARVGQLVAVDHHEIVVPAEHFIDEVGADEAAPPVTRSRMHVPRCL
jgi:hypothetical protein